MKQNNLVLQLSLTEKAALLTGKDVWHTQDIPRLGIGSISLSDGPSGLRKQAGEGDHLGLNASVPATCMPSAATVANSWDEALAEEVGAALGKEAASLEVDVLLGPGLNIKRSPLCGRNFEYFSEDPYLSGKMAAGYVRGIQSAGVAACPKHFACNSQELGRMVNDSIVDERTLREIYLTAFEMVVKEATPKAIMTSYNKINGVYGNENEHLLVDVLRSEWGFDGLVVTDWGGSNDHVAGVKAGSALQMPGPVPDSVREIVAAVRSGTLSEADVDARVKEILTLAMAPKSKREKLAAKAHHELARRAAEESIVLLKNEDNILPLAPKTRVCVVGDFADTPRYQGAGSSMVNPTRLDTPLECIVASDLNMTSFVTGYDRLGKPNAEMKKTALDMAAGAKVILFYLGLSEISETEGLDRSDIDVAKNQIDLLAALYEKNQNIVVVISAGAPIDMSWGKYAKGILHGCLSGQAGAAAMVNALTGKSNPSGKLAETYPLTVDYTPCAGYYPGREATSEYREALFVGYRYYDTAGVPVAYPFGFGLSYTTFAYSDLQVTGSEVSFALTNTGTVDGAEVAQLYITAPQEQIFRPTKELKGFAKVFLKAGESKRVTILLDDKAFRYWNIVTNRWEVEAGQYMVQVGASCADIRLSAAVSKTGTNAPQPYAQEQLLPYFSGKVQDVSDADFSALLGRSIPESHWQGELHVNSAICQMKQAKSRLARLVYHILTRMKNKSEASGKPNLNILFIYHMPLRAIGEMAGGMVSWEMVAGIVLMVNGHFCKGMGKIISGFFRHRKQNKQLMAELEGKA